MQNYFEKYKIKSSQDGAGSDLLERHKKLKL